MYKSCCALMICAIALAACATAPIEISGDAAALAPFSTFQIHEEQYVFAEEISDARRAELGTQIRQAAIQALEERGYRQASPADVLVVLGIVSRATPLVEEEMREQGIRAVDPRVLEPGCAAQMEDDGRIELTVTLVLDGTDHTLVLHNPREIEFAAADGSAAFRRGRLAKIGP